MSDNDEVEIEDLPPSRLGTKEYWEMLYQKEMKNYMENPDDSGEVWFGTSVESRIVQFIRQKFSLEISILDIGCGNGHFISRLHQEKFSKLFGMDYSMAAVNLAQEQCPSATFFQADIFESNFTSPHRYDLIHDKGTFDAISLRDGSDCRTLAQTYCDFVKKCSHDDSLLLLTSCNWTLAELVNLFERCGWYLVDEYNIPHSSFSFGGSKGQTVTSVVFSQRNTNK